MALTHACYFKAPIISGGLPSVGVTLGFEDPGAFVGSCLPGGGSLWALGSCHFARWPWSRAQPFIFVEPELLGSWFLVLRCLDVALSPLGDFA